MILRSKTALSTFAAALLFGGQGFAQDDVAAPSAVEAIANPDFGLAEEAPECRHLNSWLLGDCFSEKTGIFIEGWANGGATINDNASGVNGPVTFATQDDFMLNQLYLILGRAADSDGDRLDFGFQVDVLYGTDHRFTQAIGLDIRQDRNNGILTGNVFSNDNSASGLYGVALPQLYAEAFVPVGNGLTLKAGHFYTIIGYEVVTAPDNFFYSHAYTMQYGEPFTHTGVLASYQVNDRISVTNGLVRGWDSWNDNNNAVSFLGGISVDVTDSTNIALSLISGSEQDEPNIAPPGAGWQLVSPNPGQSTDVNRTMYSLVISQQIGEKLKYVFQHDHGWDAPDSRASIGGVGGTFPGAEWYGINQYLFYDLTEKLALGARGEWFRDDDGTRVGSASTGNFNATNYFGISLGANYKPTSCLMIRPEVRWDWQSDTTQGLFGAGSNGPSYGGVSPTGSRNEPRTDQFMVAMDVILKF